jgi:hypothetical protein
VFGTPPVIPNYLNESISKYIISISHTEDPISKLYYLNDIFKL